VRRTYLSSRLKYPEYYPSLSESLARFYLPLSLSPGLNSLSRLSLSRPSLPLFTPHRRRQVTARARLRALPPGPCRNSAHPALIRRCAWCVSKAVANNSGSNRYLVSRVKTRPMTRLEDFSGRLLKTALRGACSRARP
jgi:hypothetical protein